ncbi:TRAP transporter substrate-binding protein [Telmatospirillum sp.]|uniref:TRAP transporter substrate-binding protein n=1 Tax=Telmatospirillum sp. TaxID=2079197 RepID=UPI002844B07D|nr:TRAP transporter substrate-binding protein [Telmatospirillum sp.]MDR3440375.1 TRAP transporter substrate-binding protein [Telmatospirillum sp.]
MLNGFLTAPRAILCGLLGLLAWTTAAHAETDLTLAHNAPIGGPQDIGAQAFVAEIERLMPHHFSIDVRGGITVGNDLDIFHETKLGAVDIAIVSPLAFTSEVPAMGVLDLPFLFRDPTHAAHVLDGPVGDELGQTLTDQGLVHLAFGELGIRQLSNNKRAVRVPGDVAGLKLRVAASENYVLSFKTLGAEVSSMGIGEVYNGLREGRIDGQENPLLVIQANHFDDVQKFVSLTGHVYSALAYFANAHSFAQLTPAEQAAVRQAARVSAEATRATSAASIRKATEELRAKGVDVTETVDREAFIKALQPIQPDFERRFGAELISRIRATP